MGHSAPPICSGFPSGRKPVSLLLLNFPDEALLLLEPGPGKVHPDAGMESLRLLVMEQMGRPSSEIVTAAMAALVVHGPTRQLTEMASLHLASSERYAEVLHLLGRFEGQIEVSPPQPAQHRHRRRPTWILRKGPGDGLSGDARSHLPLGTLAGPTAAVSLAVLCGVPPIAPRSPAADVKCRPLRRKGGQGASPHERHLPLRSAALSARGPSPSPGTKHERTV